MGLFSRKQVEQTNTGFPTAREVKEQGAPSIFADHSAQGGYGKALDKWETKRDETKRDEKKKK